MGGKIKKRIIAAAALVGTLIILTAAAGPHLCGFLGSATSRVAPVTEQRKAARRSAQAAGSAVPKTVLRSLLAGSWYPGDEETLRKQLDGFFRAAHSEPRTDTIALVLPHAGYSYSGRVAAAGVKTLGRDYERIIVIGPSHRTYMEEVFTVPRVTHYQTPLGQVPLDVNFIDKLLEYPIFQNLPQVHKYEHSVQIELPLLQFKDPNFKLVPIVAGNCSLKTVKKAGEILKSLLDDKTLVVASSDFVHYGASYGYVPFTEDIARQIKELDIGALKFIESLDLEGFLAYRRQTGATICGYIPIAILLSMLDSSVEVKLIKYATSGQQQGDYSSSVSYLSIAFFGCWQKGQPVAPEPAEIELTQEDKQLLLELARKTIAFALQHRRLPTVSELGIGITDTTKVPRAAFVTLKKNGRLRGCIGDIFPRQPLYKSVLTNAVNAAFADRRFEPLQKDELAATTIEISALTKPKPVPSYRDIRIGIDGVVLNKAGRSAVFLPQVAAEQGWNLEQTLTQLSLKAGLGKDDWREGASFLVFQADVFCESER